MHNILIKEDVLFNLGDPAMPYNSKNFILASRGTASALSKIYRIYSGESSMNHLQNRINMKTCIHMSPLLSRDELRTLSFNEVCWSVESQSSSYFYNFLPVLDMKLCADPP